MAKKIEQSSNSPNSKKNLAKAKKAAKTEAGSAEQIGFHKGALTTLAKEREEMMKILTIVEQLMQMHIKALKELGVDLAAEAKKMKSAGKGGNAKLEEHLG